MTFRAVGGHAATSENLGPLRDLIGFWEGAGFSLIARPDFDPANEDGFFLELNLLRETVEFTSIGSPILNRGSRQEDIAMYGVTYLHRVTDATTGGALHIEPGVWLTVPGTTVPAAEPTIARLSTIPHGNAFCAVGKALEIVPDGLPDIPPANTVPFAIGGSPPPAGTKNPYAAYDLSVESPYRTSPLPLSITQERVDDPNSFGRDALAGHVLTHVTHLFASTASAADIGNIPFITENANTVSLDSVFSIERVAGPDDTEYMQLQYSQTAQIEFRGMCFPHVTVGTLIKAF
ncbi:MAG TPA: heme-binding protein [Solirubrobacter sp.]